jgi:RNA recognition motif-containing protein
MDIYIGNIPDSINSDELAKMFNYALTPDYVSEQIQDTASLNNKSHRNNIEVIIENNEPHTFCYAHATICPDDIARKAIQRLDHVDYQGKNLQVREYVSRSQDNDRRYRQPRNLYAVKAYNRRMSDRRNTTTNI